MASIADFFINVGADIGDFKKEMADMKKNMQSVGEDMKKVGGSLTKTVTAPIVGVGAAALAAANEFDKASNNIRAGTGATGEDLEDLNASFKEVFKGVPQDADTVSNAMADLNTRTGATGKDLEGMTKKFLDLSKVTGEDVSTSIADTTRAFESWGVEGKDAEKTMDDLWKVAQTTGIGVGDLTGKLTEAGPTFRGLGIEMDEAAAILGHWEKQGINSGKMMSGLQRGLGNIADAGKDPAKEFPKLIEQIEGAGSSSEATAIAMETFGSRAGPEMADAIRSGAMGVDELMATLDASGETIDSAASDTMSLGEEFKILKNNTMVALEPIGKILLQLAKDFIPPLVEGVQKMASWFQELSPHIQKTIMVVAAIAAAIGPLLVVAGTLISSLSSLAPLFAAVKVAIAAASVPIWPIIAAIAALVAIGVLLYQNWDTVKAYAIETWGAIMAYIQPLVEAIRAFIMDKFNQVKNWWLQIWPTLQQAFINIWNGIVAFIMPIINSIVAIFKWAWPFIENLIVTVLNVIKTVISTALNVVMGIISAFANLFTGNWRGLWNDIKGIVSSLLSGIFSVIKTIFNGVVTFIVGIGSSIWGGVKSAFDKVVSVIGSALSDGVQTVKDKFNSILDFVTGLGSTFLKAGKGLIDQMVKGITGAAGKAMDAVKDIAGKVRDFLPFSPAKEGPLSDLNKLDFAGPITDSIGGGESDIQKSMSKALDLPDIEGHADITSDYGEFDNGNQNIVNFERMFDGAQINVDDEDDAVEVARELYNMTTEAMRAKGVKPA